MGRCELPHILILVAGSVEFATGCSTRSDNSGWYDGNSEPIPVTASGGNANGSSDTSTRSDTSTDTDSDTSTDTGSDTSTDTSTGSDASTGAPQVEVMRLGPADSAVGIDWSRLGWAAPDHVRRSGRWRDTASPVEVMPDEE